MPDSQNPSGRPSANPGDAPAFVDADGKKYPAIPVAIEDPASFSGDVRLSDGTVLRVRVLVTNAAKADGLKDPFGRPVYNVETLTLIAVKETGN